MCEHNESFGTRTRTSTRNLLISCDSCTEQKMPSKLEKAPRAVRYFPPAMSFHQTFVLDFEE